MSGAEELLTDYLDINGDGEVKNWELIVEGASWLIPVSKVAKIPKLLKIGGKYGGKALNSLARSFQLRGGARGVTTADGFLFKGFTVKAPFNIPVQRFGNMSLGRPDFWGPRIGASKFANRVFGAIKPSWNPLTQYTKGVIPKGTPIKFGVIGPQGWRYPGGSLQFITPSRGVINQYSKIIPR